MNRFITLTAYLFILVISLPANPRHDSDIIDISFTSEPSGITYNSDNGLLYIVGDEGWIYECTLEGKLLRSSFIEPLDLEGIVYNSDTKTLYLLDEKKLALLEVDISDFSIKNRVFLKKKLKGKKKQFESLAYRPSKESQRGIFYIASSIKSNKSGVISSFSIENNNISSYSENPVPLWDISGLSYYNDNLHMVSDDMDSYALLNLQTNKFKTVPIKGEYQEGIALIDNRILILDEVGIILTGVSK